MTTTAENTPKTPRDSAAKFLKDKGYIVSPLPWMNTVEQRDTFRQKFIGALKSGPEFSEGATTLILGGFGALGNPSSFHNLPVRIMRARLSAFVEPVLRSYIALLPNPEAYKVEQLIDRSCIRYAGTRIGKESWHRDTSDHALDTDVIWGGWVNCSETNQYLLCSPSSHNEPRPEGGFAKITDADELAAHEKNKADICVGPGCVVLFNQNLAHGIAGGPELKEDNYRIYVGFRVTLSSTPLVPNILTLLADQAVIPLKSQQKPPMYAKLHAVNWRGRLVDYSEKNFKRSVTDEAIHKIKKSDGTFIEKKVRIVHRFMKSLAEYARDHPGEFPLYPEYKDKECKLYIPH